MKHQLNYTQIKNYAYSIIADDNVWNLDGIFSNFSSILDKRMNADTEIVSGKLVS